MITEMETLIPVIEAAALLGMSPEHVRALLRSGEMAGIKEKGRWLIPQDQITRFHLKESLAEEAGKITPFLKWAGGKTQMLKQYHPLFPKGFRQYVEPFCGGAAVYFHLYSNGFIRGISQVLLVDMNEDLINTFIVVRDRVEELIAELKNDRYKNNREAFEEMRALEPKVPILRAARTIYLNRTCFNGLYRVNRKGEFNVPFGKYDNPTICNETGLRDASRALAGSVIKRGDFEIAKKHAGVKDFVYMDPPYNPASKTSNFTGYTPDAFPEEEQVRLAKMFRELDRRGCYLMLSNSDTELVRELYEGFNFIRVEGRRSINSRGGGRGAVNEFVILNYDPEGC